MPLYGNELGPGHDPLEAGLGPGGETGKPGDFVGRAALAAAAAQAHPRRVLVGLRGETRRVPGTVTRCCGTATDVGTVTSGAPSPTLGVPIAMADSTRGGPPGCRRDGGRSAQYR